MQTEITELHRRVEMFRQRETELTTALDEVRQLFGSTAITRAVLLGRGQGLTMPLLPD